MKKQMFLLSILTIFLCLDVYSDYTELVSSNPNDRVRDHAFLTMYYDNFLNGSIGEEEKQEIRERSSAEQDIKEAAWLTTTYYSSLLLQESKDGLSKTGLQQVVKSTSSGWTESRVGQRYFQGISFSDTLTGYVIADSIYKTTDGGKSWFMFSSKPYPSPFLYKITSTKWIGPLSASGYTITTDCGVTWSNHYIVSSPYLTPIQSFFFHDEQRGWLNQGREIYKTTNSGLNWALSDTNAYQGLILFLSEKNGYVISESGMMRFTKDGGQSWQTQNNIAIGESFSSGFVIDTSTAIAVSANGKILRTSNGGDSWTLQSGPVWQTYKSIYFINHDVGWIVGWGGTILKTTDGGSTWVQQEGGTIAKLNDVYFQDSQRGWIVGEGGTILSTITGGEATDVPVEQEVPRQYDLSQNYPNPFNPITTINYALPSQERVRLSIYNCLGQLVNILVNKAQDAGVHSVQWHGTDQRGQKVASGIYFYRFEAGGYVETKKMVITK